ETFLPSGGLRREGRAIVPRERHRSSVRCRHKEEIMRYMLLICGDESALRSIEEDAAPGRSASAWTEEMTGRGVRLEGSRLRTASDASDVRVRDGEATICDGPFAETKEQVAGYDLIECADLDEAIEVAARHPMASYGAVEVRPLFEM